MRETSLSKTLGMKYPLIVAPMAGGPSSVDLVAASCEAGAMGSIGAAYMTAQGIKEFTIKVTQKTKNPFSINLFVPANIPPVNSELVALAIQKTEKYRNEFGLANPVLHPPYEEDFDQQFEAVLSLKPRVLSFVFGLLADPYLKEARKNGIFIMGTATCLNEAEQLQQSGVDAIVAQGVEAGGHRAIFDSKVNDPNISAIDLLKKLKKVIKVPVIAAGGIMNRADIMMAFHAGADAVQMGTAFLATKEAGTSSPYRRALLDSEKRMTKLTRAYSGRLARGIENRFMRDMDSDPGTILPFPAQNKFTRDLRSASAAADSAEFLSLWSGTGNGRLWTGSTQSLIEDLFSN